jgi:hypothetical protein
MKLVEVSIMPNTYFCNPIALSDDPTILGNSHAFPCSLRHSHMRIAREPWNPGRDMHMIRVWLVVG